MTNTSNPSATDRYYTAGKRLLKLGRYGDALRFFNQALSFHPNNEIASHLWTNIGHCHQELGHLDVALHAVDQALVLNSLHVGAMCLRASILATQGHFQAAIDASELAAKVAPNDSNAWAMQGRVLHLAGRDDDALLAHEQAIKLDADNVWAWEGRIKIWEDRGCYEEALAACDHLLSLQSITSSQHAHVLTNKAHSFYNLRPYEETLIAATEARQLDENQSHIWELIGNSFGMLRRYHEALDAENQALQRNPGDPALLSAKATWLYFLDRPLEALAVFDEAIRISRSGILKSVPAKNTNTSTSIVTTNHSFATTILTQALHGRDLVLALLFTKGDLPDAVDLSNESGLNNAEVWREVGELQASQGHNEGALAACAEALARDPHNLAAFKVIWAIRVRRHQYLKALAILWHAIRNARYLESA